MDQVEATLHQDIGEIKSLLRTLESRMAVQETKITEVSTLVSNWKSGMGVLLLIGSIGMTAIFAWGNIVAFFMWVAHLGIVKPTP